MLQLSKLLRFILVFLPSSILVGCTGQSANTFITENRLVLATQNPNVHFQQEMMVVRISKVLLVDNLSKSERANLHFERGVLYDSLGLWALARYDFTQALALQPEMASVYNYLGLYLLLGENYDSALEAFNMVLDLNPNYQYAYFNRGLNFYYTQRYDLAEKDFLQFYQADKTDPYRVLWLYFNELKFDSSQAKVNLVLRAAPLNQDYWGTNIVQYYLGKLTLEQLQDKAQQFADQSSPKYAEILTETYFYLAKHKLNLGLKDEAIPLFKLTMANQVYNFVEYRFALFELIKLQTLTE